MTAQQREILWRSHLYGDRAKGVDDRRPQRHQRQRRRELGLQDLFLSLRLCHGLKSNDGSMHERGCLLTTKSVKRYRTRLYGTPSGGPYGVRRLTVERADTSRGRPTSVSRSPKTACSAIRRPLSFEAMFDELSEKLEAA